MTRFQLKICPWEKQVWVNHVWDAFLQGKCSKRRIHLTCENEGEFVLVLLSMFCMDVLYYVGPWEVRGTTAPSSQLSSRWAVALRMWSSSFERETHMTSWKRNGISIRNNAVFWGALLCCRVPVSLNCFLGMTLVPCESLLPLFPQNAVSECRSLPLAVVGTHLCQALRAGYAVSLERAGLTPAVQQVLRDVIHNPPVNSGKQHSPYLKLLMPGKTHQSWKAGAMPGSLLSFQGSVVK